MRTHPCGGAVGQGSDNPLSVSLFRRYSSHISDRDKILHSDRGPGPHHPCEIWWPSVWEFRRQWGGGSNFTLIHWIALTYTVVLKTPWHGSVWYQKLKSYLDSWWSGTWQLWRICWLFDSLSGILFFYHTHTSNIHCELQQLCLKTLHNTWRLSAC